MYISHHLIKWLDIHSNTYSPVFHMCELIYFVWTMILPKIGVCSPLDLLWFESYFGLQSDICTWVLDSTCLCFCWRTVWFANRSVWQNSASVLELWIVTNMVLTMFPRIMEIIKFMNQGILVFLARLCIAVIIRPWSNRSKSFQMGKKGFWFPYGFWKFHNCYINSYSFDRYRN